MNMHGAMAKEFSAAKLYWAVIIILQVVLMACSCLSTSMDSGPKLVVLGGVMLAIPVLTMPLKRLAASHHTRGETARRLLTLQSGLGHEPQKSDLLLIEADATILPNLDPKSIGNYFDSTLPTGYSRLAHITEESAFYTRKIARVSAYFCAALTLVGTLISIGVLWIGIQTIPLTAQTQIGNAWMTSQRIAKLFSLLFGFFAAGTFLELWFAYNDLANAAHKVFERCDSLACAKEINAVAIFWEVGNYDTALAKAPPLPGVIKWLCAKKLSAAWSRHMSRQAKNAVAGAT